MKERPILFSGPMVRAILDGRKTQTRRVMKPQPLPETEAMRDIPGENRWWAAWIDSENEFSITYKPLGSDQQEDWACPYGVPGDRLWVREATWIWCERRPNGKTAKGLQKWRYVPTKHPRVVYCADGSKPTDPPVQHDGGNWFMWRYKAARFMPRWASRITLEITDVRVQRVQEISEEDSEAEGVGWCELCRNSNTNFLGNDTCPLNCGGISFREEFEELWDFINFDRGFGWDANPWVWAVTFRRVD